MEGGISCISRTMHYPLNLGMLKALGFRADDFEKSIMKNCKTICYFWVFRVFLFLFPKVANSSLISFKFSILQNIKDNLQQISGRIGIIDKKKTAALQSATPAERAELQEALSWLDFQWERINKMYKDRQG